MTQARFTEKEWKRRKAAIEAALRQGHPPKGTQGNNRVQGAIGAAAKALNMPAATLSNCVRAAEHYGFEPVKWDLWRGHEPAKEIPPHQVSDADIITAIRKKPLALTDLAARLGVTRGQALDRVDALQLSGMNVHVTGEHVFLDRKTSGRHLDDERFTYVSRPDNTFLFGACGDKHLGSKYERLDCLNDFYDRCVARGVDRVYDTGNWIDGEARFNRTDIHTHGMDAQLKYLATHHPQREGIVTYAVSGDDHEGWYAQREAIDIGRRAEQTFRDEGRDDWVDLGYQVAHIRLINANTGKEAILAVEHPGGGSAYADSYSVQKIVESLDGGEKPAVTCLGHYHKLMAGEYRNCWYVQTGCFKDRDSFARKNKLRYAVGAAIVRLEQDPRTGAIIGFAPELVRYFVRSYYNDAYSKSGPVNLPQRSAA